jgi:hypothetical protein
MHTKSKSHASRYGAGAAFAVVLVTLATTFATAGTATAAVPNIELHRSTSVSNSVAKSTVEACPAGRTLTGVGGDLTGSGGAVVIDDLTPNLARTQNTVTGFEVAPFVGNWYVHSYGICASALPGAVRVAASTATNGTDGKSVTVACPAGRRLTGAAGDITGGGGNVVMDDLRPNGNPATSVTVTGYEVNPDASWAVRAYALCANPLAGQVRVTATSAVNSVNKSVTVTCPAGRKVTGLGGELGGAAGEVVIDDYTPNELLTSVTVTAIEARDLDGVFPGNWFVRAYAICAIP